MDNDLKKKTGESGFQRGSSYDRIALNGNKGRFVVIRKDAERDPQTNTLPREDLGVGARVSYDPDTGAPVVTDTTPLKVVFLKIRRTIGYYKPNAIVNSSEHNRKSDRVMLYGPAKGQRETGIAEDLRNKYPELRTTQIVYAYRPDNGSVARISIKGASLGSKNDSPDSTRFYDYLQGFKGDESVSQFVTELWPEIKDGPEGKYFAINFKRGRLLDEEESATVKRLIDEIHDEVVSQDAALLGRIGAANSDDGVVAEDTQKSPGERFDYPEEEINPEDIPF